MYVKEHEIQRLDFQNSLLKKKYTISLKSFGNKFCSFRPGGLDPLCGSRFVPDLENGFITSDYRTSKTERFNQNVFSATCSG